MQQGRDVEAEKTLADAVAAGLISAEIYHQRAAVLQRLGKLERAEKIAQEGLQSYPESSDLWLALGQTQFQLAQLDEAKASLDSALRINPESGAAHFAAANVCLRLGEKEQAAEHRRQADKLKVTQDRTQGAFDERYEQSLRSRVVTVLSAAAAEYELRGDLDDAQRLALRAQDLDPKFSEPYRQLANIYHRQEDLENALIVQRRLMEIEPDNVVNYLNFAALAVRLERVGEAEAALLEATRVAPRNALAHHTLAACYLQSGKLAEARRFAQRAVDLEPSSNTYQLLAVVCREQGDHQAAASAEQAARRFPPPGRP
jgi:tetratricopeptide (TPR) repeat protein